MTSPGHASRASGGGDGSDASTAVAAVRVEPSTTRELGERLAEASRTRSPLLVSGGGTRREWANAGPSVATELSTLAIEGVDVFEPEEGVLHARAGTRIEVLRRAADDEGWELPLDPPGADSTVGGVIASAATGPRAQAFGRVADSVLGLEVVGADGVVTKCGGRVVKNVTGYDLGKLYTGSFGTLGVVTGAWLRLRPKPARRSAFSAPLPTGSDAFETTRQLSDLSSLRALVWVEEPTASDPEAPTKTPPGVHVELGGSPALVDHDRAEILARLDAREVDPSAIDRLRDARAEPGAAPVLLRARVLPGDAETLLGSLRSAGLGVSVDPGLGVLHARGRLSSLAELEELRRAAERLGGTMMYERLPEDWRKRVDVFGVAPATRRLMAEIKRRFDPCDVLNPGRFVVAAGTEE